VAFDTVTVEGMLFDIEAKKIVRSQILAGEPRDDGRDTRTVRAIEIRNVPRPPTAQPCSPAVKLRRWW
jgi:polyribonucleotide nucleotidyltransferase